MSERCIASDGTMEFRSHSVNFHGNGVHLKIGDLIKKGWLITFDRWASLLSIPVSLVSVFRSFRGETSETGDTGETSETSETGRWDGGW